MTPVEALEILADQHGALRELIARCDALLATDSLELPTELRRLRLAFETHNRFEEEVLRPILHREDPFAAARIDRLVEDHINEHRHLHDQLGATTQDQVRDLLETLLAHLDAEERYLVSPRVLVATGG